MQASFNTFFLNVVKNQYADFVGRSSRRQFWMFILWNIVISIVVSIVGSMLFGSNMIGQQDPLSVLFSLALLVPSLAIGARRLHDIGKSGWWQLLGIIPILGWAVLIYFFVQVGASGANMYGTNQTPSADAPVPPPPPQAI